MYKKYAALATQATAEYDDVMLARGGVVGISNLKDAIEHAM